MMRDPVVARQGGQAMFCPECGEVIGAGPLDLRRIRRSRRHGAADGLRRRAAALFGRLTALWPAGRGGGA